MLFSIVRSFFFASLQARPLHYMYRTETTAGSPTQMGGVAYRLHS